MASPSQLAPQQPYLDPSQSVWSPASTATVDRCATPSTPRSTVSASLACGTGPGSVAGSVSGAASSTQGRSEPRMTPVTPETPVMSPPPRPAYTATSRSRRQMGPTEIEKHKEEIIRMYAGSTNKAIRHDLQTKYNIKITEKQLKRVLRIWKAYKNDRGIRKATIARKHNRPPRGSRARAAAAAAAAQKAQSSPRARRRVDHTPSSDSEDGSDVEEVFRLDDDVDSMVVDDIWSPEPTNRTRPAPFDMPRVSIPPSSPIVAMRARSGPRLQIPGMTSSAAFAGPSGNAFSFNTSPLMSGAPPPPMPGASPIMPFSATPPFPSMTPCSPSGNFRNPRERITHLFMEAVDRFPSFYKLNRCAESNHWTVYKDLQNVDEQRLRQGVLIAQQNEDMDLLEETLTTHIKPMYEKLDLLAIVGIVATFAALKKREIIAALLHFLRGKLACVPERHRANMRAVLDCFRQLLYHHNGDAELFHDDLQSALSSLPAYIQGALGPQSLVGIHLIFLLNLGDTNEIMQAVMANSSADDSWLKLATSYLLAGKFFFSEGVRSPQTRMFVGHCYRHAKAIKAELDKMDLSEQSEEKQNLYHYLCRVGIWQVQCLDRQRLEPGQYGAEPSPPVALMEESIVFAELCQEDGPQSPLVIQAVNKLVDMYARAGQYWQAETAGLRIQAIHAQRERNKQMAST